MSRTISLLFVFVAAILLPASSFAVYLGQTTEDVRTELGAPNGMRTSSTREIWVYSGDITLEFEKGQLVRAKGLVFEEIAEADTVSEIVEQEPVAPVEAESLEVEPVIEASSGEQETTDLAQTIDDYQHLEERAMAEFGMEPVPQSSSFLRTALTWTIPVFLQFFFLVIAFKIVGAEAMKGALLLIAVVDLGVTEGVRFFFLDFLEFPITFHADLLASVIVMLALITKLTHAKQLATAIKVVIVSKVAAMIAFWIIALFVLHRL